MRRILPYLIAVPLIGGCFDLRGEQAIDPAFEHQIAQQRARLREHPDDPKLLYELGDTYRRAGRVFDAADTLLKATQNDPQDVRAHAALAAVYTSLGFINSSVEHLRECMRIDRKSPDCLFALGSLFELDGSVQGLEEARRAFRQLLEIAPDHPQAALVKSKLDQLNARLGPEKPGSSPHQSVLEQAPEGEGEAEAPEEGAESPHANPHDNAQANPHENAQANPHEGEAAHDATAIPGHPTAKSGDEDGEQVGELNEFGTALKRAFDAVKKQDAPAAEAAFREALKIRPGDPAALAGLAQALLALRRNDEAVKAAEDAIKSDPKDPQARWVLGLVLLRTARDVDRGVAMWEALVQDDPEYAKQLHVPEQLDKIRTFLKQRNVHGSPK